MRNRTDRRGGDVDNQGGAGRAGFGRRGCGLVADVGGDKRSPSGEEGLCPEQHRGFNR